MPNRNNMQDLEKMKHIATNSILRGSKSCKRRPVQMQKLSSAFYVKMRDLMLFLAINRDLDTIYSANVLKTHKFQPDKAVDATSNLEKKD